MKASSVEVIKVGTQKAPCDKSPMPGATSIEQRSFGCVERGKLCLTRKTLNWLLARELVKGKMAEGYQARSDFLTMQSLLWLKAPKRALLD